MRYAGGKSVQQRKIECTPRDLANYATAVGSREVHHAIERLKPPKKIEDEIGALTDGMDSDPIRTDRPRMAVDTRRRDEHERTGQDDWPFYSTRPALHEGSTPLAPAAPGADRDSDGRCSWALCSWPADPHCQIEEHMGLCGLRGYESSGPPSLSPRRSDWRDKDERAPTQGQAEEQASEPERSALFAAESQADFEALILLAVTLITGAIALCSILGVMS